MTKKEILEISIAALSAIATFIAVIVALWQARYPFKKKIKITVTESFQLIESAGVFDDAERLLDVKIANTGNRDIVISDWGIYFTKKFSLQILAPNNNQFPTTLKPEEAFSLRTKIIGIQKAIVENQRNISNYNYKKVKIYVNDSTGKKYLAKSLRSIKGYLNLKKDDVFLSKEKLNSM